MIGESIWAQWPLAAAIITVVILFLGFMWKFITKVGEAMTTQAKNSRDTLDKITDKFSVSLTQLASGHEKLQERTLNSIDDNTKALTRMEHAFEVGKKAQK